jgi:hypothetical protein
MVELSYCPYWSRNYVEAQAKGSRGGVIVLKIQNMTLGIGEARQISSDILKAKEWLDEQWRLKCTMPDGDSYWDSSGGETKTVYRKFKKPQVIKSVAQEIPKSQTDNDPDALEIL